MPCVTVQPAGLCFPVDDGQTVLQAALAAGVRLPSSCRNGTCRECRCQVLHGSASHTIPWPSLSAEEKAEGWILPCVARAGSDLVLDVPRLRPEDPGNGPSNSA